MMKVICEKRGFLVKMNRRKLVSSISMAMLLVGVIAFIFMNKESKIKGFPVPMSAIHINDEKEEDYKYISVMPITKASGWENLGENGHTVSFKKEKRKVTVVHYPGEITYSIFEK
ncbi:TPA: hypothetical protein QC445_005744 [Bacillus cereus]|uniref:Group-specific protein n=1 Tax=Bacillus cereus TaxID=1396 RepID=A0ABD7DK68_BACCE|nr:MULTISPECIES: hypothetical protein [Bacillus cereus group]AND07802.1 hypothetical protein Bt4C1_11520 [Bacillus thuringiensis serovar alesti]KAA6469108.1 hypothetical protein DX930_08050 [Bacillus cereus]KAA6479229.1 hypothetical protein DX931_12965 [Bacillus cereus]KAB2397824.1 hypothetical protein F8171_04640 [Bacillus cereus]KAB2418476.1 hypothetical protein F8169_01060 [Bacillus cereus]